MNSGNEFDMPEYTPLCGIWDVENDIPGGILDDLDAQIEDECLDGIWAV